MERDHVREALCPERTLYLTHRPQQQTLYLMQQTLYLTHLRQQQSLDLY